MDGAEAEPEERERQRPLIPLPSFTGEEGPAGKRWELKVCTPDSARPSPPILRMGPPSPAKGGRGVNYPSTPCPAARYSSDCISISRDTVRWNSKAPSPAE